MEREPNTQYVLSLSYGKDSIACIEAVNQLGYPLDRIVHAEVWATDTIPADLPPMVEFKAYADKIIKERYGIEVEHVCAMKKCSQTVNVEREREREQSERRTYEGMFYHRLEKGKFKGTIKGFPQTIGEWCKHLKLTDELETYLRRYILPRPQAEESESDAGGQYATLGQSTASHFDRQIGATGCSKQESSTRIYGFPMVRGEWCRSNLKTSYRISNEMESILHGRTQKVTFSTSLRTTGGK